MSGFDFGAAVDVFSSGVGKVIDVASKVSNAKFSWQERNLDQKLKASQIQQAQQQINLNNFMATTNVEIAKVRAQAELKRAQDAAANGYFDLLQNNMNTGIGNIQSTLNGQGSGSSIMLWLTVAGVGFAALQYMKGR